MRNMFLHIVNKRSLLGLATFLLPLVIFAQSQYDYYDDDAVAGGADRVLSGLIIIFVIVAAAIALLFIVLVIAKVYYWFNPESDPELKKREAIEEEKKKHDEFVQKQRQEAKPEAIDLGLSVKWASFNLGAYKPSDIGSNYLWSDNKTILQAKPGKLNVNLIGDIAGNPEYDTATKILGDQWRMPTAEECQELIERCTWKKSVLDNVEGYNIIGPNGNSIFLPYNQDNIDKEKYGDYWTSSPTFTRTYGDAKDLLLCLRIKSSAKIGSTNAQIARLGIRPVYSKGLKSLKEKNIITEVKESYSKNNQDNPIDEKLYILYEEQCKIKETEIETYILGKRFLKSNMTFKDEFGVIYSSDGKRLLDASDCNCATYTIKNGTEFVCNGAFRKGFLESIEEKKRKGGLWKIILPPSLVYIPESALPNICQIESESPHYCVINEILIDIRRNCVVKCLNQCIQEIVLYEPIEEIGEMAFINCDVLQEVTLPNTLKRIGKSSFYNNKVLNKINFPDSVEVIDEDAFFGCILLYINSLPSNIKYLGDSAFTWCNIQDVNIPNSIQHIGTAPFPKNCNNLTSDSKRFIINDGLLIDKKELSIIQLIDSRAESVTIPQNITKINSSAFHHCDIETICIPSNIIGIGSYTFWGCEKLREIVFDGNLPSILRDTFGYCNSLISINIPSGVEIIEAGAFNHCKLLQEVNLNKDLKIISSCAFIECPSLNSIIIPESVEVIGDRNKWNPHFFRDCRNLCELCYDAKNADISGFPPCITKLSIGEHVEVLPTSFLSYNSNIKSFTIPSNVRKVSKACITQCPKLHEIIILSKNIILEEEWIRDCNSLATIYIPKDLYESLLPMMPAREGLKIKKIYDHHFLFFKW